MNPLRRLLDRRTPRADIEAHREAAEEHEQVYQMLVDQRAEVHILSGFARWQLAENHIAPKIRRAIKGE